MKQETKQLTELTLLVLYLSGWEEDCRTDPGRSIRRAWKGHPFEVLNELDEKELITQHPKSKSIVFTEAGKTIAKELMEKYLG